VPYKRVGKVVMKKTSHGWVRVKGGVHETEEEAQDHLKALQINVEAKEK